MELKDKELSLINKGITSLLDVSLHSSVTSINLHCNHIPKIEGLSPTWHLRHLDLSSNLISKIEGLNSLACLRTLNLSCNKITKVEGLNGLVNLIRLNLSYNQINSLTGLLHLHGEGYKLKNLSLHSNNLSSMDHLLQCTLGLRQLRELTLIQRGRGNPVCESPGYRDMIFQSLPQISYLDGLDQQGSPLHTDADSPCDVPGLENYMDLLLSSDTSLNEMGLLLQVSHDAPHVAPHPKKPLGQLHQRGASEAVRDLAGGLGGMKDSGTAAPNPVDEQRIRQLEQQVSRLIHQIPARDTVTTSCVEPVRKAKRDTDQTSESDCDSVKENSRHSRIAKRPNPSKATKKINQGKGSESDQENLKQRSSKPSAAAARGRAGSSGGAITVGPARLEPPRRTRACGDVKTCQRPTEEQDTYRAIVTERDQERERRWKAEQEVMKLTEELKCLNTKVCEEKDLQSLTLHTTDRLKDLLLKERAQGSELQTQVEKLEDRCRCLTQQLEQTHCSEEQLRTTLHQLQEKVSHTETLRAQQHAEEMKQRQEGENKAAAMRRELDLQRASASQQKDKVQTLYELLASKEQEHRKQLEMRLQPGGADFREAVAREVSLAEQNKAQREAELQEKLAESRRDYAALEDEFRMALRLEAARFNEVKEVCDQMRTEVLSLRASLSQAQQREKKSASLVQELSAMVREQKSRISELIKAKRDAVAELKRLHSLEAEVEQDQRLSLQLELLKKDKGRLLAQLTAQESVIDGLRAERKIWGQELAQQGASLAQDRGRLEARIEALTTEVESQRQQLERNDDALKIKSKIIDDQTETIRKLKESMQEREEQTRRLREEAAQVRKRHDEETAELQEQVEHLSLRREQLNQQLEFKEAELEDVKQRYSDSRKKWQEKGELLGKLESQVKRMKESFDSKEILLLEERNRASEAHKAAVEKLRTIDDAFRRQLESVQASHHSELLQVAQDKQQQIERANQKVLEVEEEMRQLLEEMEASKRLMEEKMKRLSSALQDFHS
ncbi:leucine-rich repeat and coiled-coil domain-containing protein 1 isoform X2 [Synchiropus splendidus]|uniref:leucine-rich repeat and coiled-coil domain-containing protein 1 isoform X2 n=1 Tax=Synchiropus splendidus TaxID=270530 RepID=UPI00237DDC7D|nr:leucine-rich repeat and coiled-coil domain-containing protein 1 isoform X2 [Synchiropus splendidus]